MLKELLAIFRKDSMLDDAFRQSYEMLDITKQMFLMARKTLRETDTVQLHTSVYELDKKVNKYQREVRKEVLQHLAVAGVESLVSGLNLINIIIDLERIGDYTKNIVEMAESHQAKLDAGNREEDLVKIETALEGAFDRIRFVLENSDEEAAKAMIKDYIWINPLCDKHLLGFIKEEDKSLSRRSTVALALYFRYLKRIHSHLRNIATTVYRPFHKTGFIPKKAKNQPG
jgi:phosphate uptake regulator